MRPYRYTLSAYEGLDVDQVAVAQAVTALTPMTLLAPVLDIPRPVTIVSAADESGNLFHILGLGAKGEVTEEVVTGANAGTAESRRSYSQITAVTPLSAGAGNVSVGIALAVPTPWHLIDRDADGVTVNALVTGTLSGSGYRIEGYHGPVIPPRAQSMWDHVYPIDPADAVIIVAAATTSARTHVAGQFTAVRMVCLEALGAGEQIIFEVLPGPRS